MENTMQEMFSKLAKDASIERERLIKLRIKERVGEDIDLIKEAQKRFSRIVREYRPLEQLESYFWNDGSDEGLHLITFYSEIEGDIMSPNKTICLFKYR